MKKKRLLTLISGVGLILILAAPPFMTACAPAAEVPVVEKVTWTLQSAYPWGDYSMDCLPKFGARVGELSEGRLRIDVLPGGSIVPVDETLTALGKGV